MTSICLIGAGQLGSRHLQALKGVSTPLEITVVDPFPASLKTAQERYEVASGGTKHQVKYFENLQNINQAFDIAIIATNSNVRREVLEQLLSQSSVKYFILEKLLFQKREDYKFIGELFEKNHCKAWVNCSMRTMPFYADLKNQIKSPGEPLKNDGMQGNEELPTEPYVAIRRRGGDEIDETVRVFQRFPIVYFATGSQYGLITTAIHYIDHIAYFTDCYDYQLITDGLIPETVPSKRAGFLELNGTLSAHFKDGSYGIFNCFPQGDMPVHLEIHSPNGRMISRENEQKAWQTGPETNWLWQEIAAPIPFQSQMTTWVVEDILKTGQCGLTTFEDSTKLHLTLLEGLSAFLAKNGQKTDFYPFT